MSTESWSEKELKAVLKEEYEWNFVMVRGLIARLRARRKKE